MKSISPVGADLTRIYTTSEFQVGAHAEDNAGGKYVFCSFAGITVAKDWVSIDENFAAAQLDTDTIAGEDGQKVGVCHAAQTAATWGFVQVYGKVTATNVATSAAANAQINTTATAGRVDDDATAGAFNIIGAVLTAAESGNLADADLTHPVTAVAAIP